MATSFDRDIVKDEEAGIYPVHTVINMAALSSSSFPHNSLEICNKKEDVDSVWMDDKESAAKGVYILDQQTSKGRQSSSMVNLKSLPETKRYKCPICVYKTSLKSDLNRHSKKHSRCSFTCDICKMPFMSMGIVMYHKQKHHSEQMSGMKHRYTCSICPYGTKSKSDLSRHLKLHPLAKYLCYNCHFPFTNFETLELHLKTWHSDTDSGVTLEKTAEMEVAPKTDPSVGRSFSSSDDQQKRSGEGSHSPSGKVCLYLQNIDDESSDQSTVEGIHNSRPQIKQEIERFQFQCTFCPKTFEEQSMLDSHTLQFHIETQFSLSSGEQLNVGSSLIDSSGSANDATWQRESCDGRQDLLLQCSQCVFKTSDQLVMDNHVRKHHVTLYSCSTCDLPFRDIENLMQHKLQHERQAVTMEQQREVTSRTYKYHCSMCTYETDHKSTFNRHVLRHSIANYQCEQCQMPFMREGNLILHKKRKHSTPETISLYSKEQRYQCPHCRYATSYKITLQRHIKKHAIALFKCDLCDMPFLCQGNLTHHKKVQHTAPLVSDNVQEKTPGQRRFLHNFDALRKLNELSNASQSNSRNSSSFNSTDVLLGLAQCKPEIYNPYPVAAPPEPGVCQDDRPDLYNLYPVVGSDERPGTFLCTYCPTKFTNKDDFLKHINSHEEDTMYRYAMCNPSMFQQAQFEENMLHQQYSNGGRNLTDDGSAVAAAAANGRRSLSGASTALADNLLTINDVSGNASRFIGSAGNYRSERGRSSGKLNYIEIYDDDNNNDTDNENSNNNNNNNNDNNNNNNNNNNDEERGIRTESFKRKGKIENGVITFEVNERKSRYRQSTNSGVNVGPKQTATFDLGRNLVVECCDKEIQCALISSDGGGSPANDSSSPVSASLVQPPHRGRYVKLVSDFDDFAQRPFACALCYHRYSKYEELKVHIQNHLTGAGRFEEIPSTALFLSTTSD